MFEAFNLTQYLGLIFGIYFIAAGIGLLLDGDEYRAMMEEFSDNPVLCYLAGVVAFALGAVLIRLHTDWTSALAVGVSFIGWACIIEGVLMLSVRRTFIGVVNRMPLSPGVLTSFALICFVAGGWFIWSAVA